MISLFIHIDRLLLASAFFLALLSLPLFLLKGKGQGRHSLVLSVQFLLILSGMLFIFENAVYDPSSMFIFPWAFRAAFYYSPLTILAEGLFILALLLAVYGHFRGSPNEKADSPEQLRKDQEESEKFRILADHSFDWEYWMAADGRYLWISPACEKISGYSPDEFKASPGIMLDIVDERHKAMLKAHLLEAQKEPEPKDHEDTLEFMIRSRDGFSRWIEHHCIPVYSHDGQYLGRRGINRDITASRAVLEENNVLLTAVDQSPVSIVITDTDGNIEYVNSQFSIATGYDRTEVVGKNPRILKSDHHNGEYYRSMWETICRGERWKGEFKNLKKNGEPFWEESVIGPIRDTEGRITHFLAMKTDISHTKKMLEKEAELQSSLIQSSKMASLGVLSAGLAHEINNPNNYILYNAELVKTLVQDLINAATEEEKDRTLEVIDTLLNATSDGAMRINRIVQSLKSFSRQGEKDDLNLQKTHINDLIENVITMLNYHIKKATDHFRFDPGRDIPSAYWDAQKLEQVVLNLLENAIASLSDRNSGILVSSSYERDTESVRVTIRDEGQGIEAEHLDKIMEPFFSTRKDRGGTGLGMSISYGIIKEHSGELTVKSELGIGTEVSFVLPAKASEAIE